MSRYINPLVEEKIRSMDIDEGMKDLLEKLVNLETRFGNDSKTEDIKIKNFREVISKRMPNENI